MKNYFFRALSSYCVLVFLSMPLFSLPYFEDQEYVDHANKYLKKIFCFTPSIKNIDFLKDFIQEQMCYYELKKEQKIEEMRCLKSPKKTRQELLSYFEQNRNTPKNFDELFLLKNLYFAFQVSFVGCLLDDIKNIMEGKSDSGSFRKKEFFQKLEDIERLHEGMGKLYINEFIVEEKIRFGVEFIKGLKIALILLPVLPT